MVARRLELDSDRGDPNERRESHRVSEENVAFGSSKDITEGGKKWITRGYADLLGARMNSTNRGIRIPKTETAVNRSCR